MDLYNPYKDQSWTVNGTVITILHVLMDILFTIVEFAR